MDFATTYYREHYDKAPWMIPCIEPGFDHSPRSTYRGTVFNHSTPEEWGRLCANVIKIVEENDSHSDNLLFIKAWNEWAEGNYLEPDIVYGKGFINELAKNIFKSSDK